VDDEDDKVHYEEEFPRADKAGQEVKRPKMPQMPNYSKGMVRKQQAKSCFMLTKVEKKDEKKDVEVLNMKKQAMLFEKVQKEKGLHPFIGTKPDAEGWVKVKGVMDSGASESVAPPTMCPHYPVRPSPGSMSGQEYVSASEDTIPNLGEQVLDVVMPSGRETQAKYQVADVARPLNAVSEICDAGGPRGQHVVFGRNGGAVINLDTGACTPFEREGGIYCLEFWVKPVGFARQG